MDPKEIEKTKQLIDENCDQIMNILEDLRNGPPENALIVHVLGPMLEKIVELKDNMFSCIDSQKKPENLEKIDQTSDS